MAAGIVSPRPGQTMATGNPYLNSLDTIIQKSNEKGPQQNNQTILSQKQMKYANNSGSLGPSQNLQDMRGLTKTILPANQNQSHYPNAQQKTFKITTKQGSSGQMLMNTQNSNRNYNNTITLKNQR